MIGDRFGLDPQGEAGLLAELRGGLVRQIVPDDAVTRAPRNARAAGWVPFDSFPHAVEIVLATGG